MYILASRWWLKMAVILSPGNTTPHWQTSTDSDESTIYTQARAKHASRGKGVALGSCSCIKGQISQAISWEKCLEWALVKDEVGLSLSLWQACQLYLRENFQLTLLLEELWTGATLAISHASQKQLRMESSMYPNLVPRLGSIYSHKYSTVPPPFSWWMYF